MKYGAVYLAAPFHFDKRKYDKKTCTCSINLIFFFFTYTGCPG